MSKAPQKLFRCVIYTRVSTDDGLDQEFIPLDAQSEASEAYIKSQASQGWVLAKGHFVKAVSSAAPWTALPSKC